jgi:hypothetical protein
MAGRSSGGVGGLVAVQARGAERRIEIVEAKVAELTGLGASAERRTRHDGPEDPRCYVVMHDPEGNEFCVG